MSYSGGSFVVSSTCKNSAPLASSFSRNESNKDCLIVDETVIEDCLSNLQHLLPDCKTSAVTLPQKICDDELKSYSKDGGGSSNVESPFTKLNVASNQISSSMRNEFKEKVLVLDKKAEKKSSRNKKHTNKTRKTVAAKSNEKSFQKRRHKKLYPFSREHFEDKMPYVCFECKKMFAYYSSLDEHEKAHALNKFWNT